MGNVDLLPWCNVNKTVISAALVYSVYDQDAWPMYSILLWVISV
jgi:hypothetical protein